MSGLTALQREILRSIDLQGGIDAPFAEKHGFTRRGMPCPEMQALIRDYRMIAPRVLTSVPLRIVWQLRTKARDNRTLAKIESEASRLGLKEYAPGGFKL